MTDGQFWLTIFVGTLALNAAILARVGEGRHGLGCITLPLTASVAMTLYVLLFEPDPQAGIFRLMFYGAVAVAGALGAVIGQAMRKRLR